MNKETKDFIEKHISDDIRRLALRKASDGVDLRFALQQIDGRQRARTKLPTLAANPDILFPTHLSLEQCSSEATARYKREILEALAPASEAPASDKTAPPLPSTLIDLTGGFGIDFIALSPLFNRAIYVERDSTLCDIVSQNLLTLYQDPHPAAAPTLTTICADAETILSASPLSPTPHPASTLFFLDPARRSSTGARTFAISDCTPDVIALMPQLKTQGSLLMLKLSPMLDWHKAVDDIQQCDADVMQVHIVSVKNECKELLLLVNLRHSPTPSLRLICKNDDHTLEIPFPHSPISTPPATVSSTTVLDKPSPSFLLVPNASLMKAGCWDFIASHYHITPAAPNSHLFFSDHLIPEFPGRQYRIDRIFTLNKKEMRDALQGITHANISVRNFPLSADELRKRLKLKDGGDRYLFATSLNRDNRLILTSLAQ